MNKIEIYDPPMCCSSGVCGTNVDEKLVEFAGTFKKLSQEVKELLPRIRDPKFIKIVIISLAEAMPTHEAEALQIDLKRAGITPYGWIINRNFAIPGSKDPLVCAKGLYGLPFIKETVNNLSQRTVVLPWMDKEDVYV